MDDDEIRDRSACWTFSSRNMRAELDEYPEGRETFGDKVLAVPALALYDK